MDRLDRNGTLAIQRGGWLDLLRFAGACLIVAYHYQFSAPVPASAFPAVFQRGYLVTDFFLIDSGYVLGRIYAARVASGRIGAGDFFRRRVLRVVPLHLMTLAALVGLVLAAGAAGVFPLHAAWFDWRELPGELFLVQAFGAPGGHGWNTPTWSLSALVGCYLLFPLLARAVSRLSGRAALAAAAAVFLAADVATTRLLGHAVYALPLSWGFVRALPLFLAGLALARFSETVRIPERAAMAGGLAAAVALGALQGFGEHGIASLLLICVLILAAAAIPVRRPSQLVAHAALATFSLYLSNEIVRIGWFGAARIASDRLHLPLGAQWALWGGGMAAALVCGFALYAWVDAPTQRWIAARAARRRARPAALPRLRRP
ncbi:MAG: acyltransferase [Caulobacteraceae bacterium]